jgi:hypothetical protein
MWEISDYLRNLLVSHKGLHSMEVINEATFVTQYTSNQLPLSPALLMVNNPSTNNVTNPTIY